MKMISPRQYMEEVLNSRKQEALRENAIHVKEEKEKREEEEEKSKHYEEAVQRAALPGQYNKFMTSVKENFVEQCIYSVFNESLNIFDRRSEKQELTKRALVKNFVQEQGVDKLLRKFKTKNSLLSEYALICNKAINEVSESTDAMNKNSWTIDTDIKNKFIDNLDNCNSKEAILTITDRVTDAEAEFVNDNIRKKIQIDEIIQSKKDRLDAMEDKPEEVKESVAAIYDRKAKAVKNSYMSTIYQSIAESMTKNAFTDEGLKQIYIKEGNLDMKTLLEDVGIIYTFLETVYTTEMVDDSYITEFVNNI